MVYRKRQGDDTNYDDDFFVFQWCNSNGRRAKTTAALLCWFVLLLLSGADLSSLEYDYDHCSN